MQQGKHIFIMYVISRIFSIFTRHKIWWRKLYHHHKKSIIDNNKEI